MKSKEHGMKGMPHRSLLSAPCSPLAEVRAEMKQAWVGRLGWLVVGIALLLALKLIAGQRLEGNERGKRDANP